MRADVLQLALMAGGLTYLWRFLPLRISLGDMPKDGLLSRFLSATGPAAIATLFVAEMLPLLLGLLGMGGLRTFEKIQGVARETLPQKPAPSAIAEGQG